MQREKIRGVSEEADEICANKSSKISNGIKQPQNDGKQLGFNDTKNTEILTNNMPMTQK